MPLSDDQEKILSDMEAQLAESDPRLVDDISSTTVYTAAFRNSKWAILLLLVGIAIMVLTLSTHFLLAAVGFVVMLAALLILEKSLTKLGKAGLTQMMQSSSKGSMGDVANAFKKRMQGRFNKDS